MFIKCSCVGRLARNEKSRPCVFRELHKHKDGRGGQDKACGDIQFSSHTGESRILRVAPPFQKVKEKPVTANA